jgi:hypothetical protein
MVFVSDRIIAAKKLAAKSTLKKRAALLPHNSFGRIRRKSGGGDLNSRPLRPERSALTGLSHRPKWGRNITIYIY